jgi:hypothetical protein
MNMPLAPAPGIRCSPAAVPVASGHPACDFFSFLRICSDVVEVVQGPTPLHAKKYLKK